MSIVKNPALINDLRSLIEHTVAAAAAAADDDDDDVRVSVATVTMMLTFIYLHCQAPPSTFCRGRYRNFVD